MRNLTIKKRNYFFLAFLFASFFMRGQIGEVIWEDNFDNFNTAIWTKDIGDGCNQGLCGWGNQELESYEEDNVSIKSVPGEPGNNALAFEARRENSGTRAYTSGKILSEDKLSVQYGLIEVRMQVPDLNTGLWPAAWMLGTTTLPWPAKGEIDIMEMGHSAEERERQGHPDVNMNNYVGANAIFATEDGGVGSIAFDTGFNQPYVAENSMANRFITYRIYWDPSEIRYTVIDNGVENDLYAAPLPLDPNGVTGVFNRPFYFLLNLAVGGTFTDAAVNSEVTANLPATVLIDYVRVHKWNGHGTVETNYRDLEPESGTFGVFTETTPTQNELEFGTDGEIFIFGGTLVEGDEPPIEGNEVVSWQSINENMYFGAGITNVFGRNMSNYVDEGTLKFKIKIPADIPFRIGITDNFTNESWLTFGANESKYGLVRDGEWGEVEIPLADFAGLIAFQDIGYMFAISSDPDNIPTSIFEVAVDDIVWEDGNGVSTVSVTGVSNDPSTSTLGISETLQINANVLPSNATNLDVSWSSSDVSVASVNASGFVTANAPGTTIITVTTEDGAFTDTTAITVSAAASTAFVPDPNRTYYIDIPAHNLRVASSGESANPYTTTTTTVGADVEWKFVDNGNGNWHIDRVAGGSTPRLSSNNTPNAHMQTNASNGSSTYFDFAEGFNPGTYFITLPDGPVNHNRLQVTNLGEVKMVSTASDRSWESFIITEVVDDNEETTTNEDLFIEAEDYSAMSGVQLETTSDINGGQNVGFIDASDWMEYTVNIPSTGSYTMSFRVASIPGNEVVSITSDGSAIGTFDIDTTGGWQVWTTVTTTVNLSEGNQSIRLTATSGGWNINWLEITAIGTASATSAKANIAEINTISEDEYAIYPVPVRNNLNIKLADFENYSRVQILDMNSRNVAEQKINNGETTINVNSLTPGIYFVIIFDNNNNPVLNKKIIK